MKKNLKLLLGIVIVCSVILLNSCKLGGSEPDGSSSVGGVLSTETKPKAEKKKKAGEGTSAEAYNSSRDNVSSDNAKKYSSTNTNFIDSASYAVDSTVAGAGSISAKTDIIPPQIPIDATVPIPIEGQVS